MNTIFPCLIGVAILVATVAVLRGVQQGGVFFDLPHTNDDATLVKPVERADVIPRNQIRRLAEKHKILPSLPAEDMGSEKRIIYFLHIHKSAGTSMCQAAGLNHMVTNEEANCNVEEDQRCCGNNDSLAAQQAFAEKTEYTFVANEGDMYETMDSERYRYVLSLRKSRDRYLSHYKHILRSASTMIEDFATWWEHQPDNWTFRKICGTRCMKVPKYKITKELFDYTAKRLDSFDDVIFVENFEESYQLFAGRVGWTEAPETALNSGSSQSQVTYQSDLIKSGTDEEWDPMMSVLDDAIYSLALQRYNGSLHPSLAEDHLASMKVYFSEGPGRGCKFVCCQRLCALYRY